MEKMKLNYKEEDVNSIVEKIKTSPFCAFLLRELEVTDEEIRDNYDLFLQYMKNNAACFNCKRPGNCDHSTKGYMFQIRRDLTGDLTNGLKVCDKYKVMYEMKDNLLYCTFPDDFLFEEKYRTFLKDNIKLIANNENVNKIIKVIKGEKISGLYFTVSDSRVRRDLLFGLSQSLLKNNKCAVVNYSDLLRNLKTKYKNLDVELFNKIQSIPVLIIDGIGNETISTFSRDDVLLPLLDYRIQHELSTIITSEYKVDELQGLYKIGYENTLKAKMVVDKIKDLVKGD